MRRDAFGTLAQQRVTADEVALVEGDEPLEPRLERRPVGGHVHTPQAIGLLEPQRLERAVAEVDEPERLACLPQPLVELR